MNNFDTIISAEKKHKYEIKDQDQFVFDTLIEIQSQKSRPLKRLLITIAAVLAVVVILIQNLFFQSASFSNLGTAIEQMLAPQPYYLAMFNLTIIAVVLVFKRLRLFG